MDYKKLLQLFDALTSDFTTKTIHSKTPLSHGYIIKYKNILLRNKLIRQRNHCYALTAKGKQVKTWLFKIADCMEVPYANNQSN